MATTQTASKAKAKKALTPKKVVEMKGDMNAHKAIHVSPIASVILSPRITEKATQIAEGNVYTFNITPSATKIQVKEAIIKLYKVTPIKVNVIKIRQRKVIVRGKRGVQAGGRKAYVTLKKGDKIELM
jgi:large subunit ribosomal protein L23